MSFSYIGRYNFNRTSLTRIRARSFFTIFLNLKINPIKFHIYTRVIVFLSFFSFFMVFCLFSRHFSLFLPFFIGKKKKMSPLPTLSSFLRSFGPRPLPPRRLLRKPLDDSTSLYVLFYYYSLLYNGLALHNILACNYVPIPLPSKYPKISGDFLNPTIW